jgi:hypothetical protein
MAVAFLSKLMYNGGVVQSILIRRRPVMTRRQEDPLRTLGAEEREVLERISRAQSDPASHVARARMLLAVADGMSSPMAQSVGRRSRDAVSRQVSRFNQKGWLLSRLVMAVDL